MSVLQREIPFRDLLRRRRFRKIKSRIECVIDCPSCDVEIRFSPPYVDVIGYLDELTGVVRTPESAPVDILHGRRYKA